MVLRQRNTILAGIELFRRRTPDLWINNVLTFLYVCENEGLNIKELAQVSRLSEPTASRSIRSLSTQGQLGAIKPALGLVDIVENPNDGRGKLLFLTEEGRRFAGELDRLILAAQTIAISESQSGMPSRAARND